MKLIMNSSMLPNSTRTNVRRLTDMSPTSTKKRIHETNHEFSYVAEARLERTTFGL